MRKSIVLLVLFMIAFIVGCSKKIENISNTYKINEPFIFDGFEVIVKSAFIDVLEIPENENEKVLYIYINYPKEESILSKDVWLNTLNYKKYTHYSVDGLDYLGGSGRAVEPFIRFSVPKDLDEFILYLDVTTRIYINVGE